MSQTCKIPQFDKMNKEQKSASAQGLLDAAGVQACATDYTQSSFHAEMNVDFPFASANASVQVAQQVPQLMLDVNKYTQRQKNLLMQHKTLRVIY